MLKVASYPNTQDLTIENQVLVLEKKIQGLEQTLNDLHKKVDSLRQKILEAGGTPNMDIPIHGGVVRSLKPAPIGPLETKIFALQKSIRIERARVDHLQRQVDALSS